MPSARAALTNVKATELMGVAYGHRIVTPLAFEAAIRATKAALRSEGFGILCEIDVQRTLREKAGIELRPYVILGACNPHLAGNALQREPQIGLLLPCNVVVNEEGGKTIVSVIDAEALLTIAKQPDLQPMAAEVNARLKRVLDMVAAAGVVPDPIP